MFVGLLVTVPFVLAGVALALWAMYGDRQWREPRCPDCWYSMIGAASLRCPECGHISHSEADLHRRQRRWRWLIVALVIALFGPAGVLYWQSGNQGIMVPMVQLKWKLLTEYHIAGYQVQTFADAKAGVPVEVRILKNGDRVFTLQGWDVVSGYEAEDGTATIGLGDDITGDGIPDLLLHEYSGGMHCCSTHYVISLGKDCIRPVATIEAEHNPATFEDFDNDNIPEVQLFDWTFAYWRASYAASPAPEVILRFRSGHYTLAADLMYKEPPQRHELEQRAEAVEKLVSPEAWAEDAIPPEYWEAMLELIYTGHEQLAWEFADLAWPQGCPGKLEFLSDFRQQLFRSPYAPAILGIGRQMAASTTAPDGS